MSMLFAYMADGEGVGVRGFKMFCQRGVIIFSTCFVCVCVWGGQVQYLSFRPYNKTSQESLRRLSFLRYFLCGPNFEYRLK